MTYNDLIVLIPSHSLEDFPTELGEEEAAGLLNAFSIVWHPVLLAEAGTMPSWHRADEPPDDLENRLIVVPTNCDDWLPGGWIDHARAGGATIISGMTDRADMVKAALEPLERQDEIDADLVADFLAFGTCYLQTELLTRHMHHFSNLDEVHIQREAVSAAEAAVAHDGTAANSHLRACFESLTEARERFYPVDCYLIDLCLLIPRLADEHLQTTLRNLSPVNFLITGEDLEQVADEKPDLIAALRESWERGTADIIGGEKHEGPAPLLPLESALWDFYEGQAVFRRLLNRLPKTWARRRYGFSTLLPQILTKFGYHSALHVALDDGIYPDAEQSKIRWEGCDGTVIDAMTRIPLAGDSATSFLRFPQRMAESMEEDQVAGVIFARWPEITTPWLQDLQRMHKYSPSLGRFVTLDDYFQNTDTPGRLSQYDASEYLTPFLIQAVAGEEQNPISRFTEHFLRRARFETGCWCRSVAQTLLGQPIENLSEPERIVETAGPDATPENVEAAENLLDAWVPESAKKLADVVMQGAGDGLGFLLLNSLSFPRTVSVDLPQLETPPKITGPVKAVQFDDDHKTVTAEIPGAGFLWIPAASATNEKVTKDGPPTAEENVLRNEFFEVHLNEATGGIAQLKGYGRQPNRLSQQLSFRFGHERTIPASEDGKRESNTAYSEMRRLTSEVTCAGPALGEIVTTGEIIDQVDGSRLAGFRQTFRVWRGRSIVEIDTELDVDRMPEGDPWSNYYAARFAWNDGTAALTRSVLQGAQSFSGERFESPHYFEIAADDERTSILNLGQPFHRKTGPRMLDSLLITAGETKRRFQFVIAIDDSYPMQAAMDAMTPVSVVPTNGGPPRSGTSGWFFQVPANNVQITRIMPLQEEPPAETEPWAQYDHETLPTGNGFALRLIETEGRARRTKLYCFKTPTTARQRDFQGRTIADLTIEDGYVSIELTAHEIADIELRFEA